MCTMEPAKRAARYTRLEIESKASWSEFVTDFKAGGVLKHFTLLITDGN